MPLFTVIDEIWPDCCCSLAAKDNFRLGVNILFLSIGIIIAFWKIDLGQPIEPIATDSAFFSKAPCSRNRTIQMTQIGRREGIALKEGRIDEAEKLALETSDEERESAEAHSFHFAQ